MTKNPNVFDVADWFLKKSPISPKRLQKLVYYTQAWGFALFDKSFMGDNNDSDNAQFEAWAHGPVNHDLYSKYKEYGWNLIETPENDGFNFDSSQQDLLESIWETYGSYSPNEIENLTHSENPWINARKRSNAKDGESCNELITPEDMREYYLSIFSGSTI